MAETPTTVLEAARWMAENLGAYVIELDHPDLPECIGMHATTKCDGKRGKHNHELPSLGGTASERDIIAKFSGATRNYGVTWRSGLLIIDEDTAMLADYAATIGEAVPATFTVSTGRDGGGRHLYFRLPAGVELANGRGKLPNGIDVRGNTKTGYVVGPGSQHQSGRAYTATWDVPAADAPQWLLAALAPAPKTTPAKAPSVPVGSRPIPERAVKLLTDPVVVGERSERFYAIVGAFKSAGQTIAEAVAALEDWCERNDKFVGRVREETERVWPKLDEPHEPLVDDVNFDYEPPADGSASDAWVTPDPVDTIDITPLPDSADRRPDRLWRFVDAQAEALQVPREMVFMLVLSILSTATRDRWLVRITPDWTETLAMYTATTMPSASRKSAAVSSVARPLYELETEWQAQAAPLIAQAAARREVAQAKYEQMKRRIGSPKDAPKDDDVMEAKLAIDRIDTMALPRLLADDVTPEKLAILMHEQGGPLGVVSDEGTLFSILCGRYSRTPNLDLVLKAHVGRPYQADRVNREPLNIRRPFLGIGVTIQPGVLEGLGELPQLRDTGLLARFLYALPPSNVGRRTLDPEPMPGEVTKSWAVGVAAILDKSRELTDRRELPLTDAAEKVLRDLRAQVEPMLDAEHGALVDVGDWAGKLPGALVRIAALLTIFDSPGSVEIAEWSMVEAVGLANWLTSSALRAFDMIHGRNARTAKPRAVLVWIKRTGATEFTVRQLRRALGGQKWADADSLRDVLADLEDMHWIRRRPSPDTRGAGRPPSEVYDVNPAALAGTTPIGSVNFVNRRHGA